MICAWLGVLWRVWERETWAIGALVVPWCRSPPDLLGCVCRVCAWACGCCVAPPQVSKDVLEKCLTDFGVSLSVHDLNVLVAHYDYDKIGNVYYNELFHNVCT